MATTSIWKVEKRLDVVVDYVVNEKKTNEANYYELHKVEEYVKASYKTEEQLYVTAINCDKDRNKKDISKRRWHTSVIMLFNLLQREK